VLQRIGKHEDAAAHRAAALAAFEELQMTFWLRRAETDRTA
jgi:hypothetical protein